jgi:predicted DNA-binding transcriptional regulator YafY
MPMSKRGYISRYSLILKKLQAKPYSTYEELESYIERQYDYMRENDESLNLGFSKRTLQRDIKEIRQTFGIDIQFSNKDKGYYISQSETDNQNFERMIEAFDMFNSLNMAQDLQPFIHLEKRRPQGTENLYGLLHAIKNRLRINFSYQKFWEDEVTQRITEPYALKEFKSRWYILAKDLKDGRVKTFALDRLTNLEITKQKFQFPRDYDVEESYRYCFGIISPDDEKPAEIILSFDPIQGKYIKTLPLHQTQAVLIDDEDELRIKLKLCITHDFLMELLSFGENVKVIQPKSLMNQVKAAHKAAFEQYK